MASTVTPGHATLATVGRMRAGVHVVLSAAAAPAAVRAVATTVEADDRGEALAGGRCCVEGIWVADAADAHELDGGGDAGGTLGGAAAGDAMVLAGALARWTRRVTVGVLVDLAWRGSPALVTKEITAIDRLSGGRAALGLGWGPWLVESPRDRKDGRTASRGGTLGPSGVGPSKAADAVDEAASVHQRLLHGPVVAHTGRYWSLRGAVNRPGPATPLGPPLVLRLPGRHRALAIARQHQAALVVPAAADVVARTQRAASAMDAAGGPSDRPPALVGWCTLGGRVPRSTVAGPSLDAVLVAVAGAGPAAGDEALRHWAAEVIEGARAAIGSDVIGPGATGASGTP